MRKLIFGAAAIILGHGTVGFCKVRGTRPRPVGDMRKLIPAAAAVVAAQGTRVGNEPVVHASAFNFAATKISVVHNPHPVREGFSRLLHKLSGGDFHGYPAVDGTTRVPVDPLHTTTVRWRLTF